METSIRFIRVYGKSGVRPALCFRGRNQAHAVINDGSAVRVVSNIPLRDLDQAAIVSGPHGLGHIEYPVTLFVQRLERIARGKQITQRAKFLLDRALAGGLEDDEKLPPDEVDTGPLGINFDPGPPQSKEQKRAPDAPKPAKPASKTAIAPGEPSRTAGADVIRRIAIELKLEPPKLRKLLRSKGLHAPYDDEAKIRAVLK